MMPLSDLRSNSVDIQCIVSLFLKIHGRVDIAKDNQQYLFSVTGDGHDGERQFLTMNPGGIIVRGYLSQDGHVESRAPSLDGKVLAMLLDMGYELRPQQAIQARRYRQYVTTGISFLSKQF